MLNVADARNVQIIVESHSEHLMRRLQRRVAVGEDIPPPEEREAVLRCSGIEAGRRFPICAVNEWGEIENWPANFFGDEMGEIAAISEASPEEKGGAVRR